jgi:hypothetical protein
VTELEEHLRDVPDLGNHTNDRHRPTRRSPMILALAAAGTAIAVGTGTHLIWIRPLLWFAGPSRRRRPRTRKGAGDLALPPITSEGAST